VQAAGCQKIAGVQSKVLVWDSYRNETGVIGRVPRDRFNLAVGHASVGLKIADRLDWILMSMMLGGAGASALR
jgi:hypothetical protein